MFGLTGKSLVTLKDYTPEQINYLVDLAIELKAKKRMGIRGNLLAGKNVALIFEKPSTRTRCAFTVACVDEGAYPEYLGSNDIQLGHKESVKDTARVLGRLFDAIEFRGFSQKTVEELAQFSGVPVYNGLTDEFHPTQILADLMTIKEHLGSFKNKKFVYIGDGRNNMANSLMIGCTKVGMDITIIAPKSLLPEEGLVEICKGYATSSGAKLELIDDINGVVGADVIYTDVWCSMGEEDSEKERVALLTPYQVNADLIKLANNPNMIFMHCLPAVKGKEVTEEVFEAPYSVVFDEAENRMHTIKAVMVATLS
ncbi:MAG: ornithine carbamoyltransferase [Epulopiscium sp. Nele67-Bin005]|nr:MAG: ornithine carbamoyltransferase [Epulopiscium sp. Nele67-Bin005]